MRRRRDVGASSTPGIKVEEDTSRTRASNFTRLPSSPRVWSLLSRKAWSLSFLLSPERHRGRTVHNAPSRRCTARCVYRLTFRERETCWLKRKEGGSKYGVAQREVYAALCLCTHQRVGLGLYFFFLRVFISVQCFAERGHCLGSRGRPKLLPERPTAGVSIGQRLEYNDKLPPRSCYSA